MDKKYWIDLFLKFGIPASVAISVKLAIQSKKEKITPCRAILSFIVGIGSSYIVYPIVSHHIGEEMIPLVIAMTAISSEKISEYLIYKFNIDYFLTSIIDAIRDRIINFINPKK